MSQPSVLIVEDDPDIALSIQLPLELDGIDVRHAGTGGQAWDELNDRPRPDVVLLDIGLPDMSGWSLLAAIRGNPALAGLRVVAMSANPNNERSWRRLGADAWLPKPFRQDALRHVLVAPATASAS